MGKVCKGWWELSLCTEAQLHQLLLRYTDGKQHIRVYCIHRVLGEIMSVLQNWCKCLQQLCQYSNRRVMFPYIMHLSYSHVAIWKPMTATFALCAPLGQPQWLAYITAHLSHGTMWETQNGSIAQVLLPIPSSPWANCMTTCYRLCLSHPNFNSCASFCTLLPTPPLAHDSTPDWSACTWQKWVADICRVMRI